VTPCSQKIVAKWPVTEQGMRGDGAGRMDGLTTVSHNGAKKSTTSVWLSLPDKQTRRTKADKRMTCFTAHWLTATAAECPGPQKLGKHFWPRPRLSCRPLPCRHLDPTLWAICRSAPHRRPHDLIKCNYHQPLVLTGRRAVSAGRQDALDKPKDLFFNLVLQQFLVTFWWSGQIHKLYSTEVRFMANYYQQLPFLWITFSNSFSAYSSSSVSSHPSLVFP